MQVRALNRRPANKTREGKETTPVIEVGFLINVLMKVVKPDQVSGLPVLVKEADLINMQVRWYSIHSIFVDLW